MEGTTDKKQQQQQSWKSDWLTWHFGTLFLLLHEQHLFLFFEPGYRNQCEQLDIRDREKNGSAFGFAKANIDPH